jgi:hypothetical protein
MTPLATSNPATRNDRRLSEKKNPEEILRKLQVICKNMISDVNDELSQYKDAKRDLSEILHYLSNDLDQILYTHQLRFEDIDNLRCTYINF